MRRSMLWTISVALSLSLSLGRSVCVQADADHTAHAGHGDMAAGAFSAQSLYHVDSPWTTASGQRLRLRALSGKVQVVAMVYTSCEYACPLLVDIMQRLEAALAPALRSQVGFVLVTFDPEHDTPAVLQAYSIKHHLAAERWTLLHGHPDDVLELAVLLGVQYKKEPQGGFAHSNLITVLNPAGEIVHRHLGLESSLEETLAVIRQAAQRS